MKINRNGTFKGLVLHIILAGVVVVVLAQVRSQLPELKSKPAHQASQLHAPAVNGEVDRGLPATLKASDTILTDSILSIVQSFYVEQSRVRGQRLLEGMMETLERVPGIRAGGNLSRGHWMEVDGLRYPLLEPGEELNYLRLLSLIEEVADILNNSSLAPEIGALLGENYNGLPTLLNVMLTSLDAHSSLLSPEAYLELRQGTEGSFGGLGVLVGIRENLLTVIKPIPKSPAIRNGLKKHDRILGINGVSTYGFSLDHLVEYMRGDPGTEVKLTMLREGMPSPFDVNIVREIIQVDSVTSRMVPVGREQALHMAIENFSSRTSREVLAAIKKAKRQNNGYLPGLILDLRGNPGGLLDQAVQVADLFLKSGVIVSTKGRREEIESAGQGYDEVDFPIVLLINEDSASASEIVAGALQDHNRAVVIGRPSFGKGSVQTIFELPGERALKLTIARYYTPQGRSIQNIGIIPDIWLQPIQDGQEQTNDNLLGMFRYRNERFLKNHLSEGKGEDTPLRSKIKSYYLTDQITATYPDFEQEVDLELDVAKQLIAAVRDTYGPDLPEGTRRASHWLGLAGEKILGGLKGREDKVQDWLQDKFAVDWRGQSQFTVREPQLGLAVEATENTYYSGDYAEIQWRITNKDKVDINRLSIFVRSESNAVATKEVLVGKLKAGTTRSGKVQIYLPKDSRSGPTNLRVGLAIDAWPIQGDSKEVTINILSRANAMVHVDGRLMDDGHGEINQVLESDEKTHFELAVQNSGLVVAHNVKLDLVNLAGGQLYLQQSHVEIGDLLPGETRKVKVGVTAADRIYRDELGIGVSVASDDLVETYHQYVIMAGRSANEANSSVKPVGH